MGKIRESARKIAEKISDGKELHQHLGSHSFETLQQELFSLANQKPMYRDSKWYKKADKIYSEIINGISKGKTNYQSLIRIHNSITEMR